MIELNKSEIIPTKPSEREKVNYQFQKLKEIESEPIEITLKDRLLYNYYNISEYTKETAKKLNHGYKFVKNYISIYKDIKMSDSPITTKLGNKAFWIKVIGTLLILLGFLGLDFNLEPQVIEQVALFISAGVSLVIGFFFDKKQAEETKDKND
jgi:hypothetical protein